MLSPAAQADAWMRLARWKSSKSAKQEIAENPPPPTPESMLQGGKFTAPPAEPEKEDSAAEQPPEDKPAEPVKIETVRVKVDGEELLVMREDDVMAVIEG